MIEEIKEDLQGVKPSCIVASVGGGGLSLGILSGLEKANWTDVPLLCMETVGAECFNLSLKAGQLITLEKLSSIAKTLGARSVTPAFLEIAQKSKIISEVLEDKEAVNGCIRLADDHGFLVEPSCGVTVASIYSRVIPEALERQGYKMEGPIILIVCGGTDMSHEILTDLAKMFNLSLQD